MSSTLLRRSTSTTTCRAFEGSLVAPCPNPATRTAVVRGERRAVCPAHTASPLARCG